MTSDPPEMGLHLHLQAIWVHVEYLFSHAIQLCTKIQAFETHMYIYIYKHTYDYTIYAYVIAGIKW